MQFNMLCKWSAADYTQIGHGITDGALQGMDVSKAWKLARDSAVNYTPAALQPHVSPLEHNARAQRPESLFSYIQNKCDNSFTASREALESESNNLLFLSSFRILS